MAVPTWGMLQKSQVDPETIEEAIARLIAEHNEDEEAHLGPGQSLQSHKASEIIDHLINSIVADKIKDYEISPSKSFDYLWNRYSLNLESADGWYSDKEIDFSLGGLMLSVPSSEQTFHYLRAESEPVPLFSKDIFCRMCISLSDITQQIVSWTTGPYNEDPGEAQCIGFKVVNGNLYALHTKANGSSVTEYTTLISGVSLQSKHIYSFYFTAGSKIEFYVDNVLKATHDSNLPNPDYGHRHMFYFTIQNTENDAKFLFISELYWAQKN